MDVTLTVEKLIPGGLGLARTPEGVALVAGALPGETVKARLIRKKNHLEGEVIKRLTTSPLRVDLPLPPGADLPMRYEAQLEVKRAFVEESLRRIGKVEAEIRPTTPSPNELGYRTTGQYLILPTGGLGQRKPKSSELVPLKQDLLAEEHLNQAFTRLASWPLVGPVEVVIQSSIHEKGALVGLIGGHPQALQKAARALVQEGIAGVWWGAEDPRGRFRGTIRHLAGRKVLIEVYGQITAPVDPVSFSQVNPLAAGRMYGRAVELVEGGERAVELHAGVGVLSLMLSEKFREVVAVEINRRSVQLGQKNATKLGRENVTFHRDDAKNVARFLPADLVVLDPPRSGLDRDLIEALGQTPPPEIVYIACDPSTWARDVGRLVTQGYRLCYVEPFDFFPYTHHVEILSLLVHESPCDRRIVAQ